MSSSRKRKKGDIVLTRLQSVLLEKMLQQHKVMRSKEEKRSPRSFAQNCIVGWEIRDAHR